MVTLRIENLSRTGRPADHALTCPQRAGQATTKPQVEPVPDRSRTGADRHPSGDLSAVLAIEAGQVGTGPISITVRHQPRPALSSFSSFSRTPVTRLSAENAENAEPESKELDA